MWNDEVTVESLKVGMKIGSKIASYACTCSRYAGIVGEFRGFEEVGGYTMAKVYYPPVKDYDKYTINGTASLGPYSYNPYEIYKNEFDAKVPLNGIFIVSDQSKELGTVLNLMDELESSYSLKEKL